MSDVTLKIKGLENFLKALKGKLPVVRVGILGDSPRVDGLNNATVGAFHEYGTASLPVRSFLRVPLTNHLESELEDSGLLSKEAVKEIISEGTLVPWLKKVGIAGEAVVAEGFNTGGYGEWPPSSMANKANHQTLVETTQLRNSITSDVKGEG